jgi:antirestriction protein ArdC
LNTFQSAEHYYATFFHELTHWTSDKTRCDRDLSKGKFGNADYAFEELVAELGAAFMCQQHGIKGDLRHAGYIESWLKCLKSDSRAIFKASALAQQASDFLLACGTDKQELIDDSELLAA